MSVCMLQPEKGLREGRGHGPKTPGKDGRKGEGACPMTPSRMDEWMEIRKKSSEREGLESRHFARGGTELSEVGAAGGER